MLRDSSEGSSHGGMSLLCSIERECLVNTVDIEVISWWPKLWIKVLTHGVSSAIAGSSSQGLRCMWWLKADQTSAQQFIAKVYSMQSSAGLLDRYGKCIVNLINCWLQFITCFIFLLDMTGALRSLVQIWKHHYTYKYEDYGGWWYITRILTEEIQLCHKKVLYKVSCHKKWHSVCLHSDYEWVTHSHLCYLCPSPGAKPNMPMGQSKGDQASLYVSPAT